MRLSPTTLAPVALGAFLLAAPSQAQQAQPAAPPAQTPQATTPPQRRAAPRPTPLRVIVRDVSGSPLAGVKVVASGPAGQEAVTDDKGSASLGALHDGTYRLRFERDGFVTLERDITVRAGQPSEIYAAMKISAAAPAPAPPPAPAPAALPPVAVAPVPAALPVFVSVPAFLEKNFLGGRDPIKESVLGCLSDSTTRLLQIHDAIAEHTHSDMDEILYSVAGEGTVRLHEDSSALTPGSLSIIPRGVPHAIDRRGKNPLILISVLSGMPCANAAAQPAATKH